MLPLGWLVVGASRSIQEEEVETEEGGLSANCRSAAQAGAVGPSGGGIGHVFSLALEDRQFLFWREAFF